jgi:hypothetical protein
VRLVVVAVVEWVQLKFVRVVRPCPYLVLLCLIRLESTVLPGLLGPIAAPSSLALVPIASTT